MSKLPVLIVDDSPANLKVARVSLESEGYEVRTAADGEEAWRMLASFSPRVILMDLQLPGLDGFELTRRIKAEPSLRHIRIIAVTAYAMKGDRERALSAGCDDYLSKPIDPILLPGVVANHVRERPPAVEPLEAEHATMLVIEDNPTTRKLLRVALQSEGYSVHEAAGARDALEWLEHHRPRLILQDLVLPDMDGLELVQRLRGLPTCESVPILCLSGFLARMDDAKALSNGFSALLIKPIDPIQLLEIVRGHLRHSSTPPPAAMVAGPHVLVVDDDPLQRRLAEYHLTGVGFRVTAVSNAKHALEVAERSPPDAIVSDVLMPEMDGFELCLVVRRHPLLAKIPVILVSSHYTEPGDHALAEQVGASNFVARSGDWAGAVQVVRDALSQTLTPRPLVEAEAAREAILRRTLAQLERQLRANTRLGQQCLLQTAQLSVLAGVADALACNTKLDGVLGDVLAVCLDLAGISKGALYLRRARSLVPEHWVGFNADEVARLPDFFGQLSVLEQIIAGGQLTAIPSATITGDGARLFLQRAGIDAALVVPVTWGERVYGALLIGARGADVTDQEPVAFARVLGGQIGQAMGLAETFARLHASEERLRVLVDSMDHVTVVDREQHITGMYGRGLAREPIDSQAFLGKHIETVLGPLDRDAHQSAHARALAGESVMYDWSLDGASGLRHFQAAVSPVRDAQGNIVAVVRVGRDVTEQKRMQAQIMVSDRMASVGMLAAGVAHEINNPLMAVLGNLELAIDDLNAGRVSTTSSDFKEALTDAFDGAQRVEAIVRDLRLFARAEEERISSVDVQAVLDSTLRMARNEIRHRACLVKDYRPVPPVRCNEARLGQVFLNLLINAAQAIPEGHADTNEIRVSTQLNAAGRVLVEIADTGSGVPAHLAAKLFTPFVTTKPPGVGTGLGLAICQRIVTAFGGEISFDHALRRGAVFRVVLPIDDAPATDAKPLPSLRTSRRRGCVLVIDDDAAVGGLVRKALTHDHDVIYVPDARQALECIGANARVDVILCDLMMPVMTGEEFYSELLRVSPGHASRVVFLTGGAFTAGARAFVERTTNLCVEKPCDLNALRQLVNERVQ